MVPSPSHHLVVKERPHRPRQLGVGMRRLPPQNPRPRLASLSTPQNRQIPPQTPQPNHSHKNGNPTQTDPPQRNPAPNNPDRSPQHQAVPIKTGPIDPSANRTRTDRTEQTGSGTRTEQTGPKKHRRNPNRTQNPDREPQRKPDRPNPDRTNRTEQTEQAGPAQARPNKPDRETQRNPDRTNQTEQAEPINPAQPEPNKPDRTSRADQPSATSGRTNPQRVTAWEGDSIRDQIQGAGNAKASQDRNG